MFYLNGNVHYTKNPTSKVFTAKIFIPLNHTIAIRSFFKNSAKNLNQYMVCIKIKEC